MQLLEIYEDYKEISQKYVNWIEELTQKDFEGYNEADISLKLEDARQRFETMMEQSGALEVDETQETNYKDLRYLVMDALFLATDLAHFYKCKDLGRFKMRVLNYLNKKRRSEMFGANLNGGNCPIM